MNATTIRELNANISKAISRVEAGETLDIVKNGKVVAEIRPKAMVRDAAWHEAYARLIAAMEKGLPLGIIGKLTEEDKYEDAPL